MAAAFQSSAFQQNAFQTRVDQTVAVTGVFATGAVGSVSATGSAVVTLTGVFATGAVGSVSATGSAVVTLTGVFATGAVGSVSATGSAVVTLTGVFATGAVGSVSVSGIANVPVTGVSATVQLGNVYPSDNEIVYPTGVFATGETGSVFVVTNANVSVTGVFATGEVGSVSVSGSITVSVTGVFATGAVGTVSVSGGVSVFVTGVTATGETGTVTVSITHVELVTGVSGTGFVSSVDVFGTAIVAPTGPPATGSTGTVTVVGNANVSVTGLSATANLGTVSVVGSAYVYPSGVFASGSVGTVTVSGTANVTLTGVSATGQTGTITVSGNALVNLSGVSATGFVGTVSVSGSAVVTLSGVFATAELGNISITAGGNVSINVSGVVGTGETGTVSVATDAVFSVTGVLGTTQLGTVTVIEGVGVTVVVTGLSTTGELGTVVVAVPILVTGVSATGAVGTVTVFAQANIVVSVTGVEVTGFIGNVEANPALYVPVTGVFATGYVGNLSSWITVDDYQECDWGDIPEGPPSDWIPIEPCVDDNPWVNPIETVQFVPAYNPNWEQPSVVQSEDCEMRSWAPVPIGASNSWTNISPCDPRIDTDIATAGLFATGEVGAVTSGSVLIIQLTNANLLSTGQIGTVIVPLGVSGVEATGVVEDVDVVTPTGELVSLLRAWSVYDIYGEASIGFPNYQDAQVFEGSQAPLVTPLNVWANYFSIGVSSTQTKNTEYSLLYYTYDYQELGGQAVYEYPYPVSDTIVDFNSITGDYTQELWVYLGESPAGPAPEGIKYYIIDGNGDTSNFPLISGYELFVNDTYELVFSIWIDAADYYSPTYTISGGTVPLDEWVHLAVSRSSNVIRIFINGVSVGTITYSGPIPNTPASLSVSSIITPLIESTGASIYTDSFRWINGRALYTSNFTPPAYLSPYFSDVVGLYMVGSVGDVYVDAPELLSLVRPWSGGLGSTSSYPNFTVANINGGANIGTASDVFDGVQAPQITPDYLWFGDYTPTYINYNTTIVKNYNYSVRFPGTYGGSIATNTPPRGDDLGFYYGFDSRAFVEFTCEMWIYVSSTNFPSAGVTLMQRYSPEEFSATIILKINSARELQFQVFDYPSFDYVVDISGGTVPLNSWVHLAVSRGSSSTQIFINGTVVASTAYNWDNYNTGYALGLISSVGYSVPTTYVYLDSFRLIGNNGLYTSNFTPPAYLPNYPQSDEVFGLYMVTSVGTVTVPEP